MQIHSAAILTRVLLLLVLTACGGDEAQAPPIDALPRDVRGEHDTRAITEAQGTTGVTLRTIPEKPHASEETRLELQIRSNAPVTLEPIAEKPMHLFVVNRDLTWHRHLHPEESAGSYGATLHFPADGEYVVYSIFRRAGGVQEVSNWTIQVGSRRDGATPLERSEPSEHVAGYMVELETEPPSPVAGGWTSLVFRVSRAGRPVTNLSPKGSLGHIMILREGAVDFAYAHSTDGEATGGILGRAHAPSRPSNRDRHDQHVGDTGPQVTFHTRFPKGGRYRIWAQFKAGDDIIEPDFTIDVSDLPRSRLAK